MKKNGFLTFCFSFIPGAGQMYQDYMKRGLSIMTLFAISCALWGFAGISIFAAPIPIIYAYSFFDTYNIRNKIGTDRALNDGLIWDEFLEEGSKSSKIFDKKNKVIGFLLVLVGAYLVFSNILRDIGQRYGIEFLVVFASYVTRYLPTVIISTLSIWFGTKLMINKK